MKFTSEDISDLFTETTTNENEQHDVLGHYYGISHSACYTYPNGWVEDPWCAN